MVPKRSPAYRQKLILNAIVGLILALSVAAALYLALTEIVQVVH
jgi:hypothetical protein